MPIYLRWCLCLQQGEGSALSGAAGLGQAC